jgi:hypothetical protein
MPQRAHPAEHSMPMIATIAQETLKSLGITTVPKLLDSAVVYFVDDRTSDEIQVLDDQMQVPPNLRPIHDSFWVEHNRESPDKVDGYHVEKMEGSRFLVTFFRTNSLKQGDFLEVQIFSRYVDMSDYAFGGTPSACTTIKSPSSVSKKANSYRSPQSVLKYVLLGCSTGVAPRGRFSNEPSFGLRR